MKQFHWHEYNVRELAECGIPRTAIIDAKDYFGNAMAMLAESAKEYGRDRVEDFFNEVFRQATDSLVNDAAERVRHGDFSLAMRMDDIAHAMSHLKRYSITEIRYLQVRDEFQSAVEELIGG